MTVLDGHQVYGLFKGGAHRLRRARTRIDRINVFPVPDGDTGTNLFHTVSGAVNATVPHPSASITLGNLADAALLSARGNSGVIFAQFVSGLSEAVERAEIRAEDFARAIRIAYVRARAAVTEPRDGTILSVIEDWAAALARRAAGTANLAELIGSTMADLTRSLALTTERLACLKQAGVVDAGAAGFVEFVAGAHAYLVGGLAGEPADAVGADAFEEVPESVPGALPAFRYCTEATVSGDAIDAEAVRSALARAGDCLIVAGGRRRVKIHLHTDDPAAVMAALTRFGAVGGQKADDMRRQYADAHDRRSATAIVTDSSCDLSPGLMEKHNIHVVPLLILAGGSEYLDRLTLEAPRLRTLIEGKGGLPRSSQPPAPFFSRLYANLSSHYDGVVAIHLSAALSGTFAASRKEAEKTDGSVAAFDSRHLSGSLGLIVLRAAEAAEAGTSREAILARLDEWSSKARILVSVTSLRYMVRGGRVSPLTGWIARLLNLKPIVSVDSAGKSILYGRAFSEKANLRRIIDMVLDDHRASPLRCYAIGHAGAPEKAAAVAAELDRRLGFPPLYVSEISAVVALNSGPGAVSVVTMKE